MTRDVTLDAQGYPTALHPDQHALALVPGSTSFVEVSDGGLVREDGPFVDQSADCATRG